MDLKYTELIEKLKDILQDEKKRAYAIISAAVVFSVLYAVLLIVPTVKHLGVLAKNTIKMSQKNKLAEKDVASLAKTEERLNKLREEFAAYSDQVPGTKEIAGFLDSLALTAKDSNVRIISVTPLPGQAASSKAGDLYSNMMVVIAAKGGYHEIRRFVGELENGKGFPSVRDMRLQYDAKFPTRHDAHIVLKIFVSTKGEKDVK